MKLISTLFLLVFSMTSLFSQLDWKKYEEPDGNFKRLSINPSFDFDTDYDGQFTDIDIDLSSSLSFNSTTIDTFSILSVSSNNNLNFGLSKQNDNDTRYSTRLIPQLLISYDKYQNERRGLFLHGSVNGRMSMSIRTNADTDYNDFVSLSAGIGTGRIENVSTVYQAIRIKNQLSPSDGVNQEDIFKLADIMRGLDYNQMLDSRMERIQNQERFLGAIKNLGYSVDTYYELANALDAYNFERPSFVGSGSRFLFEVSMLNSFDNDFRNYSAGINHTYQKPINEQWHWSNRFLTSYDITNEFITVTNSTQINYFPSGRTRVSFLNNISYFDGLKALFSSSLNYNVQVDMNYFVSPTLSVFGNFSYEFMNIQSSDLYRNDLSNSIGFRKFLI